MSRTSSIRLLLCVVLFSGLMGPMLGDSATQTLPFSQGWSNTGLITLDDDWSGVPGIIGYRGDGLASGTGTSPQTIIADGTGTPVDVNANQANPNTFITGGVAEFHLADPTIVLQGSGTAKAPFILISLKTAGKSGIRVQMNLRDVDGSADNAVQPIAVQYRVGNSGNFTSVFSVADATTGPNLATLLTPVDVILPAAADNQSLVQVRVITTDAAGSDEWVGVDDINITGSTAPLSLSPSTLPGGVFGLPYSQVLTVQSNQGQLCIFGSTGTLPAGLTLNSATANTLTLSGVPTTTGTFNFNIAADCGSAGSINPAYSAVIGPPPNSDPQLLPFSENWTDISRIMTDDDWSGVPGIIGYRGDDLTTATGTDPRTIIVDGTNTPVDVNANQTSPNTFATGGVAEFHLANPAVALSGSGTADAPFVLLNLNTTGKSSIRVQMNLRDLDGSTDDAVQQIAVQYRVGNSGNFANVFYLADATTGPSLATLVTAVDATLPSAADDRPWVQIRVMTTNAVGNDEWVGVDDISIDGVTGALSLSPSSLPGGAFGTPYSRTLTIQNNQGQPCTFGSTGTLPTGLTLSSATDTAVTLSGSPAAAGSFNFNISADCGSAGSVSRAYSVLIAPPPFVCEVGAKTSTAIHGIQGTGTGSPQVGALVDVEGIVVGDFQSAAQLRGFYLQEPEATWDADPLTSEGIFIFDNLAGANVTMGDRVRVRGTVSEFGSEGSFLGTMANSQLTEIGGLTDKGVCSTGNSFARTTVTLPVGDLSDFERYEGMAVQFMQGLRVTGNFNLGTFGQLDLAPSMLFTPTSTPNAATWPTQASLNRRSVIALDDASTLSNASLFPTIFPQGGLSASNTLRAGDMTTTPLVGVLDERFGQYRVQATAPVTFHPANARPAAPVLTGTGDHFYRAVSANVLNFFTTFGSRGAANQTEFDHQKTKLVEALYAMNGDVLGLTEIQNFANGSTNGGVYTNAALQSLVDGLNCKAAGLDPLCANSLFSPFALVDSLILGSNNGTDAIRNAIVYRSDRLDRVGSPAAFYQSDTNRPTLAQTFKPATGAKPGIQTFTFVVNHFKSKGSACGGTSDDVFQGNCNGMRLSMATGVTNWLATNPTNDPGAVPLRQLLVGDFNAYYGEDPMQYLNTHGYTNLIHGVLGSGAYSYNFGSQAGYLDHALANGVMNSLVKSVAEWHSNADEPGSLQALNSNVKSPAAQAAYYAPDPYAASDHDPIVIGFNPLAGDLNDDGVVDAADQQLLSGALGKNAAAVDRRMDYDGDGRITLNDYRLWTAYYRVFVQ